MQLGAVIYEGVKEWQIVQQRDGFGKIQLAGKYFLNEELEETAEIKEVYGLPYIYQDPVLNVGVDEFFKKFGDKFIFCFCTIGDEKNIANKELAIAKLAFKYKITYRYDVILDDISVNQKPSKSQIDMNNGLFFVDDNLNYLKSSNCPNKILIKNHRQYGWNYNPECYPEDLYVANTFHEISQICDFYLKHKEMMK